MDLEFGGNGLQDIAALVAGLVALGLALQAAVGPTVMFLTEAVKASFNTPAGKGGLIAVAVGMAIGLSIGFLTAIVSEAGTGEYIGLALCGAFAGLFMGAGAVKEHKASGSVNTEASAAIQTAKEATTLRVDATNLMTPMNIELARMGFAPEGFTKMEPAEDVDLPEGDTEEDELDSIVQAGPGDDPVLCDCTPNEAEPEHDTPAKRVPAIVHHSSAA